MKRFLAAVFVCFAFSQVSHAWIFESAPDRTVRVSFSTAPAAATLSTTTILVDLSDTTNWPHKNTRHLDISSIRVDIDKIAASTGSVRIGVVNTINTSTGSVAWFFDTSRVKNVSNTDTSWFINVSPNFICTRVEGGLDGNVAEGFTPSLFTNDRTVSSTAYQSDVKLNTARGVGFDVAPGRGDIILEINKDGANPWIVNVDIDYNSPPAQ